MEMREDVLKAYREGMQESDKNIVNEFLEKFKRLNIDIFKTNLVVVDYESYYNNLNIYVDGKLIYSEPSSISCEWIDGEHLYYYLQHNKDKFTIIQEILGVSIKSEIVENPCEFKCSSGFLWWKKEWVETHNHNIVRYTIDFSNIN